MGATKLKTRIGINFDEPRLKMLVDHKVQSQKFKVMISPVGV
jgi:hypothetical protein